MASGSAPPVPTLLVGRDKALRELKLRMGVSGELGIEAERLVALRTQKGMTQKQLAERAAVSAKTIQDIEQKVRTEHYAQTVDMIAAALGVGRADLQRRLPAQVLTVVRGWAGVGKTAIAAALAHDVEAVTAYPDAVLWASLGQRPSILSELAGWGRAAGVEQVGRATTVREASALLTAWAREKRALLIVDDVWDAADATPFRIGGRACATLVTTRLTFVADELAPRAGDVYQLEVLDEPEAMELLEVLAPDVVHDHPKASRDLIRELEGLPLALQVAGRLLNAEAGRGWGVTELLRELREDAARLMHSPAPPDMSDPSEQTRPTIAALLKKSTDRLDPLTRERYAYLGAFVPKPATFRLDDIAAVWHVTEADAKLTVGTLVDRGLLEPIGEARFWIHAVLAKHALSLCEE